MMLEIEFRYFENPDNERLVREIIERYRGLLPSFIRRLCVDSVCGDSSSDVSSTRVMHEYGLATIEVHDPFWDSSPKMQLEYMCHEMVHVAHSRILNFVRGRVLAPLKESNPELYTYCDEEFRERIEEFTQHFTDLLARIDDARN